MKDIHTTGRDQSALDFDNSINRLGRVTSIIALFFMFSVPLGVMYYFNLSVNLGSAFLASTSLIAIFLPMAVVENVSYYPILGAGGIYLSSITGNILNMKLPSAISGQKIAQVEPGTPEGDIVSILAIGVSSLVTTFIVFLGMLVGQVILPFLKSPVLEPAFANTIPALLGAIAIPSLLANKKYALPAILMALGAYFLIGAKKFVYVQSYVLIVVMVLSVVINYTVYSKKSTEKGN